MKNEGYVPDYTKEPDVDLKEFRAFHINFQKSVLLSLLERKSLTQAQYECCMEKVIQKYAGNQAS